MGSHEPLDRQAFLAALPRAFAASPALVTNRQGHILLLKSYRPWWQLPGGVIDPGEDPATCAVRELREETGLALGLGPLAAMSWVSDIATSVERMPGMQFYYDMGSVDDDTPLTLQEDEIDAHAWIPRPRIAQYTGELRAQRIRAGLDFRTTGTVQMITHHRTDLMADDARTAPPAFTPRPR